MRPGTRLLLTVALCGAVLIVIGLLIGMPTPKVEGAYFDRANGVPAYAGVFSPSAPGLFDPADGNLWIGAGGGLLAGATAIGLWRRLRSTESLSSYSTANSAVLKAKTRVAEGE
jgi:hypothetical protein